MVEVTTVLEVVRLRQQVLEVRVERVSCDQQLTTLCNRHTDVIIIIITVRRHHTSYSALELRHLSTHSFIQQCLRF